MEKNILEKKILKNRIKQKEVDSSDPVVKGECPRKVTVNGPCTFDRGVEKEK